MVQQYLWLSIPFYNLALVLVKLSALFLYMRIFRSPTLRLLIYIVMGFLTISGLWMVLNGFVFCVPVSDFWNASGFLGAGHCLPYGPIWFSNAGIQIFTDAIILIMPMPPLWRLQLPRGQKVGLMLIFGLGIL